MFPFSSTHLAEEIWIKPELNQNYSLFWYALLDTQTRHHHVELARQSKSKSSVQSAFLK